MQSLPSQKLFYATSFIVLLRCENRKKKVWRRCHILGQRNVIYYLRSSETFLMTSAFLFLYNFVSPLLGFVYRRIVFCDRKPCDISAYVASPPFCSCISCFLTLFHPSLSVHHVQYALARLHFQQHFFWTCWSARQFSHANWITWLW